MLHLKTFLCSVGAAALWGSLLASAQSAVVSSIKPLGFIASAIADGVTPTEVLLPDGASEHDYALRPSDVKRLQSADLVVWVGPEMEAFMAKSMGQLATQKSIAISMLPEVKPLLMTGNDNHSHTYGHQNDSTTNRDDYHAHAQYNLHIWLSPEIARLAAVAIHDKLVELMPQSRTQLDANLLHFEAQLAATDKQVRTRLAPLKGKGYFVFHDAYGYYETHYGLTPLGHFTVNPEIQPGAQRLHEIRTELVEHKAVCVFAEPQFRPAVINAVARGTSVRSGTLDPLGIGIKLGKDSYMQFITGLADQYSGCLKGE